jgi:amidase
MKFTNMLWEFNNWKGSGLHDGWSPVGGQTQSAYVDGGVVEKDRAMGHSVGLLSDHSTRVLR